MQQEFKDQPLNLANLFFEDLIKENNENDLNNNAIEYAHHFYMCVLIAQQFNTNIKHLLLMKPDHTTFNKDDETKILLNVDSTDMALAIYVACDLNNMAEFAHWLIHRDSFYFQGNMIKVKDDQLKAAVGMLQENNSLKITDIPFHDSSITLSKEIDEKILLTVSKRNSRLLSYFQ